MNYPNSRGRRLRKSESLRTLTSETRLHLSDFIYPIFVSETIDKSEPISSMPGIYRYPCKQAADEAARLYDLGILSVILFGIPAKKDLTGSESVKSFGIVQKTISEIKARNRNIVVVTDVCLCEYTEHGHCGILKNDTVDNDATIKILAEQAVSHAHAGADIVAPSAMMDGQVGAIRQALDENGFYDTPIMAYSAKYASAFYGPFRDAAQSAPQFGDRKGYQMNGANSAEALREIGLDIEEGADIVMVKPALAYLDIIARAGSIVNMPIAAYNVSGEYSMVKLMAANGIADEKSLTLEILTSIKRAGADIIISYHAPQLAEWLKESGKL
jgi:porphobilinogen synthase